MRSGLLLLVFVGGGIGSVLRYALATAVQRAAPGGFPAGTFLVNLAGCFAVVLGRESKVRAFLERIDALLTEAGCGVLVTLETVEVLRWAARPKA